MGLFGSKKKVEEAPVSGEAVLGDGTTIQIARRIDCLGVSCPRPQLMTKKAVNEIAIGEIIEVLADNPSSVEALPPLCDDLDATHLETVKASNCWRIYIRKD
ncbi:MAG: sulfurtransferase TusA family protein [Burkholderiaceae bacterium]|nr:sulfurtransferase TusA family protein [Sulfuritalea sp.]MCF8175298.1 sulfurtransferase TusA family protein [Burkholderiaceae bacterium]